MAIRVSEPGTEYVITGPDDTRIYQLLVTRRALKLEIETGMVLSRGSLVKLLQTRGITKARTRRAAYADLDSFIVSLGGISAPLS